MASSYLDKQTACRDLSHDWLVQLHTNDLIHSQDVYIESEYLKIVFLNNYNSVYYAHFCKSSHICSSRKFNLVISKCNLSTSTNVILFAYKTVIKPKYIQKMSKSKYM